MGRQRAWRWYKACSNKTEKVEVESEIMRWWVGCPCAIPEVIYGETLNLEDKKICLSQKRLCFLWWLIRRVPFLCGLSLYFSICIMMYDRTWLHGCGPLPASTDSIKYQRSYWWHSANKCVVTSPLFHFYHVTTLLSIESSAPAVVSLCTTTHC